MGYRLKRTIDTWMSQTQYAIPLGTKAIEDVIREVSKYEGIEVITVEIKLIEVPDDRKSKIYSVCINHRDIDKKEDPAQFTAFYAGCERKTPETYDEVLRFIKQRQSEMPAHLRGLENNVSEEEYNKWLNEIRESTGYVGLSQGDIWVHWEDGDNTPCTGTLSFGYITRQGEIAFYKYLRIKKINYETFGSPSDHK